MEDWVLEFINKSHPARSEILALNDEKMYDRLLEFKKQGCKL